MPNRPFSFLSSLGFKIRQFLYDRELIALYYKAKVFSCQVQLFVGGGKIGCADFPEAYFTVPAKSFLARVLNLLVNATLSQAEIRPFTTFPTPLHSFYTSSWHTGVK
jgi:hypothetical protein